MRRTGPINQHHLPRLTGRSRQNRWWRSLCPFAEAFLNSLADCRIVKLTHDIKVGALRTEIPRVEAAQLIQSIGRQLSRRREIAAIRVVGIQGGAKSLPGDAAGRRLRDRQAAQQIGTNFLHLIRREIGPDQQICDQFNRISCMLTQHAGVCGGEICTNAQRQTAAHVSGHLRHLGSGVATGALFHHLAGHVCQPNIITIVDIACAHGGQNRDLRRPAIGDQCHLGAVGQFIIGDVGQRKRPRLCRGRWCLLRLRGGRYGQHTKGERGG